MGIEWEKKQGMGKVVKLGDGVGQVKLVEGLFLGAVPGKYGKPLYNLQTPVSAGGEVVSVPHNVVLGRILSHRDVGKLLRITFLGTIKSKSGNPVKDFNVETFDGPPTPEIRAEYPRYGSVAKGDAADFAEKPAALQDEDDDLPF